MGVFNPSQAAGRSIRLAAPKDLMAINAIFNHYVRSATSTWQDSLDSQADRQVWYAEHQQGPYPVTVMDDGGEIVGWASLSPFRNREGYRYTVESSIYVRPDCHRQGIGKALMLDIIERAKKLGHHSVIAGISADQTASRALHEHLGFEQVAYFKEAGRKFDRWLDVVFLQLML